MWADLGCGEGAFTLALRELAGPGVEIHAVDRDGRGLAGLRKAMEKRFPGTVLRLVEADFREQLGLLSLDGIIAANSLHFVARERQAETLSAWRSCLRPGGRLVLVEYDSDDGNRWVPYPVSFDRLGVLAAEAGFGAPVRLADRRTRIMGRMYAALAFPLSTPAVRERNSERGQG